MLVYLCKVAQEATGQAAQQRLQREEAVEAELGGGEDQGPAVARHAQVLRTLRTSGETGSLSAKNKFWYSACTKVCTFYENTKKNFVEP